MSRQVISRLYTSLLRFLSHHHINLEYKVTHYKFSSRRTLPAITEPPKSIKTDIAFGVQNATKLFLTNGIGHRDLIKISNEYEGPDSLTLRWRRMMETFLGVQVHVIAGLGYPANDEGLALYNQHLVTLLKETNPNDMESLRLAGYQIWKNVLMTTFNIPSSEIRKKKINIIEARNIMHQVSMKMIDPEVIDIVTEKCNQLNQRSFKKSISVLNKKHEIIQEVMVHKVYLSSPSLVEKVGFGSGEKGYVIMQIIISEYQHDPLIAQYIGSSMFRLFQAAGIDIEQFPKDIQNNMVREGDES